MPTDRPDNPTPETEAGGLGGSLHDRRLEERALRESWPMPEPVRRLAVKRLVNILANPDAPDRAVTAACRVLVSAGGLNLDAIKTAITAREAEDLAGRLAALEERLAGGGPS